MDRQAYANVIIIIRASQPIAVVPAQTNLEGVYYVQPRPPLDALALSAVWPGLPLYENGSAMEYKQPIHGKLHSRRSQKAPQLVKLLVSCASGSR